MKSMMLSTADVDKSCRLPRASFVCAPAADTL